MKDNKMSQKDLSQKLNVSPQYIHKLIHGQDLDLKISTALRYGRILGLKLIVLPEDELANHQVTMNYYHITATIGNLGRTQYKYTESNPSIKVSLNN